LIKKWRIYTLERGLSWFEIFLWVVANPVASGFIFFSIQLLGTPGLYGGSNVLAYLASGLIYIPIAAAFMYISLSVQRAAAPYVLISRAVSPVVAYLAIWYYIVASGGLLSMGFLVFYGLRALAANILLAGRSSGDPLLTNIGIVLDMPIVGLYLGILILLLLFFLAMVRASRVRWVLAPMVLFPLAVTIAYALALYASDTSRLLENWYKATGLSPSILEDTAFSGGATGVALLKPAPFTEATSGLLIASLWAYAGLESASFMAGEVREPAKSYTRGYTAGFLTVLALYLLVPFIVERKLGVDFIASYSYLYYNYRDQLRQLGGGPLIPPSLFAYLSLFTSDKTLIIIGGLAAFLWFLNTAYTTWLSAIRILYALSVDRIAPASLSRVTGVRGIPVVANNVVFAFGVLGLVLGYMAVSNLLPVIPLLKLFNFSYSILVWLTGVSLATLPWLGGEFYKELPYRNKALEAALGLACFTAGWFMLLYSGIGVGLNEVVVNTVIGLLGFATFILTVGRGGGWRERLTHLPPG
jgi:amino acid transporter